MLDGLRYQPLLLAGFRRGDLKVLRGGTLLIWEPNLDNRAAALLGNLTNRRFLLLRTFLARLCRFDGDLRRRGFID